MPTLEIADLTTEQLLQMVGGREVAGYQVPADLDAPHPTPYGDNPPVEWLLEPHPEVVPGATGIITDEGRFCAYAFEWDRCHNSWTDDGTCWMPPRSVTGNRYFHQGAIIARAGDTFVQMPCGAVTFGAGHADISLNMAEASAHYDRPDLIQVRCRIVENDVGGVLCGSIVPGTTYRQVGAMRAAALSGDWRWVPELGAQEFLGPCFVARPGLPLGLEQAATDAVFWDIARQLVASDHTATTAAGLRVPASVFTVPVLWTPRPTITTNLPAAVVAAAQGATMSTRTITLQVPEGVAPDIFEKAMSAVAASGAPTPAPPAAAPAVHAAGACGCQQGAAAAATLPLARTAAAGTSLDYTGLDENVREAINATFAPGEGNWAWTQRWDDGWAVFELETTDPITGAGSRDTYWVAIEIDADGTVTVDRTSAVKGHMEFRPDAMASPEAVAAAATKLGGKADNVVAAGDVDPSAFAEVSSRVDQLAATVASIAEDVATLVGRLMTPADAVEELPQPPELM